MLGGFRKLTIVTIFSVLLLTVMLGLAGEAWAQTEGNEETEGTWVNVRIADNFGNIVQRNTVTGVERTVPSSKARTPGEPTEGTTYTALLNAMGWIFYAISYALSWLTAKMVGVMLWVASYPISINKPEAVAQGWEFVRDIGNNFFIILLLVIAVGTILRVPNYNRQLLPKLLVMAVLINFSKMFTGVLIDFFQIVMLTFAGALKNLTAQGIILTALGLPDLFQLKSLAEAGFGEVSGQGGILQIVVAMIFAVIVTVVALVVIAIISIILVYRIIMLWFLTILSPLAFVLTTFPRGQRYASEWWDELAKHLIVGPVMVFFLYVSVGIMVPQDQTGSISDVRQNEIIGYGPADIAEPLTPERDIIVAAGGNQSDLANSIQAITKLSTLHGIINFMIVIGLMVGSLVMGQRTGAAGGQWAGRGVASLRKWGKRAAVGLAVGAPLAALRSGVVTKAAYGAGGSRVPILQTVLGKRLAKMSADTTKQEQEKINAAAPALVGKSDDELMRIASSRGVGQKYQRIKAMQMLAEKGTFKDDSKLSDAERNRRVNVINQTREDLQSTPDLLKSLDDNLRKYSPSLALRSDIYTKDGKLDMGKVTTDMRTGTLDLGRALANIDPTTLANFKAATGGQADSIAKFLLNNTDDDKALEAIVGKMNKVTNKEVLGGVNRETFRKADGSIDKDMREKFLNGSKQKNLTKVFDKYNAADEEEYKKYWNKHKTDIKNNIDADEAEQLAQDFSHLMDKKDIDDLTNKFKDAITKGLENAIDQIASADYRDPDKHDEIKQKYANALMGGATFDMTSSNIDPILLNEVMGGKQRKDILERINKDNINKDFIKATYKNLGDKELKTISDIDQEHKQALQSAINNTIKDTNPLTADGREMTRQLMTKATLTRTQIDYSDSNLARSSERKKIFADEVAPRLTANNLRSGAYNAEERKAIIDRGNINALKSFFADTENKNIELSRDLSSDIRRRFGPGDPTYDKLKDYL